MPLSAVRFKAGRLGGRRTLGYCRTMTLMKWGRGLLFWGIVAAVLSFVPALLVGYAPPAIGDGFVGLVAILLPFSVTPIAVLAASVGAILLLVAVLRRDRF